MRIAELHIKTWSGNISELKIKVLFDDNSEVIFLFLTENWCCDPSLELSHRDSSIEGHNKVFYGACIIKKIIPITTSDL